MKLTWYIPILSWGPDANSEAGNVSSREIYNNVQDVYGFNPDAVGHYEVSGDQPTRNQFEAAENPATVPAKVPDELALMTEQEIVDAIKSIRVVPEPSLGVNEYRFMPACNCCYCKSKPRGSRGA